VPSERSSGKKENTQVYVANLDPSTSEGELLTAFKKSTDGAYRARLVLNKETGASKGAAFIDFGSAQDA
jgi:RNA recognition motif-containing protein